MKILSIIFNIMREFIKDFIKILKIEKGLADNSLLSYNRDLVKYHSFMLKRQRLDDITLVKERNLRAYVRFLNAENMSANSIKRAISCIRTYHNFYYRKVKLIATLFYLLIHPKLQKNFPAYSQ